MIVGDLYRLGKTSTIDVFRDTDLNPKNSWRLTGLDVFVVLSYEYEVDGRYMVKCLTARGVGYVRTFELWGGTMLKLAHA